MQAAMDRLGSFISRRRRLVLGAWIALLVVSLPWMLRSLMEFTTAVIEKMPQMVK